jgi:hypothetical protein
VDEEGRKKHLAALSRKRCLPSWPPVSKPAEFFRGALEELYLSLAEAKCVKAAFSSSDPHGRQRQDQGAGSLKSCPSWQGKGPRPPQKDAS